MAEEKTTGQVPELWKDVVVDECSVLDLTIETRPEVELGFGATVCLETLRQYRSQRPGRIASYLRLIEDFLGYFGREDLWRASGLQDLVLAEREVALESILGEGEAQDELLPWEQWPI